MKKLLLIVFLLSLVGCSTESSPTIEPSCDCKKVHKFYNYMDNQWILISTVVEDIEDDCSKNGQFQTIMHDNGNGWSTKEDITTECN